MGRKLISAALAGGILAGGAAVAAASIPSGTGAIQGCYTNKNLVNGTLNSSGALRVIDAATESCRSNETPISWSQTGPQGPVGPQGVQGLPGTPGEPATKRFAVVKADGTITASSSLNTDPTKTFHSGTGQYTIGFNDNVRNCAMAITPFQGAPGVIHPIVAKGGFASDSQIYVVLWKLDSSLTDEAFAVTVTC